MAPLYAAFGAQIFDTAPDPEDPRREGKVRERRGTREFAGRVLGRAGLPLKLADAVDDDSWDLEIRQETDEALLLAGRDVGTPIIHFEPPAGVAFFGPVISRLPHEDSAVQLWDHVVGWHTSRVSPSSSEVCERSHSLPRSELTPIRPVSRRTGTAVVGGRRSDPVCEGGSMSETRIRSHQESVRVQASGETLYDMVSDTAPANGARSARRAGGTRKPRQARLALGSPGTPSSRTGPGLPGRRWWW